MTGLALILALAFAPQQARGPVADDDGTGAAAQRLTQRPCRPGGRDEVVICKRDDPDRYRLGPITAAPVRRRALDPALRLPGGGEARTEAQQHDTGFYSVPAAMLSLRIPLGAKKKKPPQQDQ